MDPNPYDPTQVPPQKPVLSGALTDEDKTWGLLAHLSPFVGGLVGLPFLGPLVVYLMYKDKSEFINDQAKESLNFQLAVMIAALVCTLTCVGIILLPVIGIG